MKKYILIILIIPFFNFSQENTFKGISTFVDDAANFISAYDKKFAKSYSEEFPGKFKSYYSEEQQNQIVDVANTMILKKIKHNTVFKDFLESLLILSKSDYQDLESISNWLNALQDYGKIRSPKKLTSLLEFSNSFFIHKYIYESSSVKWILDEGTFEIKNDDGPRINFKNVDILLTAKNDSSRIYNTSGTYNPMVSNFIGQRGRITWKRVEFPEDETFAELSSYRVSMRSPGFKADSVKLTSPYFDEPILGRLNERVVSVRSVNTASYPEFESYNKNLKIKDLYPNVDYEGGFKLIGRNIEGISSADNRASMTFNKDQKAFIIANSKTFVINPDYTSANKVSFTLFMQGDLIEHPSVDLKFDKTSKLVTLSRTSSISSQAPFTNSYQQINMNFEALYWTMESDILNFGPMKGNSDKKSYFESNDYFSSQRTIQFRTGNTNLLSKLKAYSNKLDSKEFKASDFASYMLATTDQIQELLARANAAGIIYYNADDNYIYVKDKLDLYQKSMTGKGDFDNILIQSEAPSDYNANINLKTLDLTINGVKKFPLSDQKFVSVYPNEQTVIMKKNREMHFSGAINVGRTEYIGKDYTFFYPEFKIDAPIIDYMRIRVFPMDNKTGQKQVRLLSKIENLVGEIKIDDEKNKSGLKEEFLNYPEVNITNNTFVYYNDSSIYRAVYEKDKFNFKLDPFTMDSLSVFSNAGIKFPGEFISSDIFPKMKETLSVQSDYSLGFIHNTPASGYNIFQNKAKYVNRFSLSHKGLKGTGDINFITSSAQSDDITFLPTSILAIAHTYKNKEQKSNPNVPLVEGTDVKIKFLPYDEVFFVYSRDSAISMYGDEYTVLNGQIKLDNSGMKGEGTVRFKDAEMLSSSYYFKSKEIDADTAEFTILALDEEGGVSMSTDNVKAHVSFVDRKGHFVTNAETSQIDFPANKYICFMEEFVWFMDRLDLEFKNNKVANDFNLDAQLDMDESNFFSTHPRQDSLSFGAAKARYDMKEKILICDKVERITVADARIYPDSGHVEIRKNAKMQTLKNAKIVANYITQFHNFQEAEVNITAKRDYTAKGVYELNYEGINSKFLVDEIKVDTGFITTATGIVSEENSFYLNPNFKYYGEIKINANNPGYELDGNVSLSQSCDGISTGWFKFNSTIDTSNILIPIETDKKSKIASGMVIFTQDSVGFYTTFLTEKRSTEDQAMSNSTGFLAYNNSSKEFIVAKEDKIKERSIPGNLVALNTETCELTSIGKLNFANKSGQIDIESVGELIYNDQKDTSIIGNATIKLNFPFLDEAVERMNTHFNEIVELEPFIVNESGYYNYIREMLKAKDADQTIADLNLQGTIKKFPKELNSIITLVDAPFYWNPERQSFIVDDTIGIASIGEHTFMKEAHVIFELVKDRTGDRMNLYIKLYEGNWYFFTYKRGLLSVVSSDSDFNTLVGDVKEKDTEFKGKKGEDSFQFMLGSSAKARIFLDDYLPVIEEPVEDEEDIENENEEEDEDDFEDEE